MKAADGGNKIVRLVIDTGFKKAGA